MKIKITTLAKQYGRYVAVLVAGLFLGGITVQAVSATVPDSNGSIHGCRNNITTMLRVIDSASASCGADETGLNWDQNGVKAYARVTYNSSTEVHSIDSTHSKNVSAVYNVGSTTVCLTTSGTPNSVSAIAEAGSGSIYVQARFKDQSGWISPSACNSSGSTANVEISLNEPASFLVTIF